VRRDLEEGEVHFSQYLKSLKGVFRKAWLSKRGNARYSTISQEGGRKRRRVLAYKAGVKAKVKRGVRYLDKKKLILEKRVSKRAGPLGQKEIWKRLSHPRIKSYSYSRELVGNLRSLKKKKTPPKKKKPPTAPPQPTTTPPDKRPLSRLKREETLYCRHLLPKERPRAA